MVKTFETWGGNRYQLLVAKSNENGQVDQQVKEVNQL
jgi:hypothetical protein